MFELRIILVGILYIKRLGFEIFYGNFICSDEFELGEKF